MQEPNPQSTVSITNDKEEENNEEEVNFHSPLHPTPETHNGRKESEPQTHIV